MKVFVFGLDGMTHRVVRPYVDAGLLPHFKQLIDEGCSGVLRSTIPPITGPGWTSMVTGKNPGKHGIYEFKRRKGYEVGLVTKSTSAHAEPLWSVLGRNDRNVIVVNVPFTYPPDKVNGVMVSGFMTPSVDLEFVHPRELKGTIFDLIHDYRIDVDATKYLLSGDREGLLDEVSHVTGNQALLMNYLLDNHPWDLFFMVLAGPDRVQHLWWDDILAMDPKCVEYYQSLDRILGDVMDRLESDTVLFVASDHGFMPAKKVFYVNKFLEDRGLLALRKDRQIKSRLAKANVTDEALAVAIRRIGIQGLKKVMPPWLSGRLKKLVPRRDRIENLIDWDKTRAFSLLNYGIVSINLKGREPNGVVEPSECSRICSDLREDLLELKDPDTGGRIVKEVFEGSEIYSSEHPSDRPDLVIIASDGYSLKDQLAPDIVGENRLGRLSVNGDHDMDGLLLACGPVIDHKNLDASIYDLMPTILYLMGIPIPHDVDGRVLTDMISPDFVDGNEAKFDDTQAYHGTRADGLGEDETEQLQKHLRDLGYLG
jgi:predicted AlkP superfamily phosphohydrolase/phosphomutase